MAKRKQSKEQNNGAHGTKKKLDIEHHVVPVGQYSNHLIVQSDPDSFYLRFFQISPPMILGETEAEIKASLEEIGSVRADSVATVIVSKGKMPAFIEAMQKNLQKRQRADETGDAKSEK